MKRPRYWNEIRDLFEPDALSGVLVGSVAASDGYELNVYEMGRTHPDNVLMVNAPGMPFPLLLSLAQELSRRMHVITWESRGCPDVSASFSDSFATVDRQSEDLLDVASRFEGRECHVVTWSAGAFLLLDAMRKGGAEFLSKTLLAPSDLSSATIDTPFHKVFFPLFARAARGGEDEVTRLRKFIVASQNAAIRSAAADSRPQRLGVMFARNTEAARRYSLYFQSARDFAPRVRELYARFSAESPFLIVHATDDPLTDYRESLLAFEEARLGTLILKKTGGHYLMCDRHAELCADIQGHAGVPARDDLDPRRLPSRTPDIALA